MRIGEQKQGVGKIIIQLFQKRSHDKYWQVICNYFLITCNFTANVCLHTCGTKKKVTFLHI